MLKNTPTIFIIIFFILAPSGVCAGEPASIGIVEERYPDGTHKVWGRVEELPGGIRKRIDIWTFWFPNGNIKAQGQFRSGEMPGEMGETGIPIDGRDGLWSFWHQNGHKRQEAFYSRGKLNGAFKSWFENGEQEATGNYVDDRKHGKWSIWWDNEHKRFSCFFVEGRENGKVQFWHENGQASVRGTFRDGLKEGKFTYWYPDGTKMATGNFVRGKREGRWLEWGRDGKLKRALSYNAGRQIGR